MIINVKNTNLTAVPALVVPASTLWTLPSKVSLLSTLAAAVTTSSSSFLGTQTVSSRSTYIGGGGLLTTPAIIFPAVIRHLHLHFLVVLVVR